MMQKAKFDIQGMTCSSCSSHVDKAVNRLDGVKNVSVNLLSNSMTLEFDEKKLSTEDIVNAVDKAGYQATLATSDIKDSNGNIHNTFKNNRYDNTRTIKSMKKRLILSFFFLIILMFISMHHMIFKALGMDTPVLLEKFFHGNENSLTYAFTQLLLLLPIIYLNRNYFITGFKRLLKLSPNMDSLIAMRKWNWNTIWNICYLSNWVWLRTWTI